MLGWDKARCKLVTRRSDGHVVALDAREISASYQREMSGGRQQRIGVIALWPPIAGTADG